MTRLCPFWEVPAPSRSNITEPNPTKYLVNITYLTILCGFSCDEISCAASFCPPHHELSSYIPHKHKWSSVFCSFQWRRTSQKQDVAPTLNPLHPQAAVELRAAADHQFPDHQEATGPTQNENSAPLNWTRWHSYPFQCKGRWLIVVANISSGRRCSSLNGRTKKESRKFQSTNVMDIHSLGRVFHNSCFGTYVFNCFGDCHTNHRVQGSHCISKCSRTRKKNSFLQSS